MSLCTSLSLTQPVQPFTRFPYMIHTTPVCSCLYNFSICVEHSHWSYQTLIDTSCEPHGMMLWLQVLHNVILHLQFIFEILTQLSHLTIWSLLVCIVFYSLLTFNINLPHLIYIM